VCWCTCSITDVCCVVWLVMQELPSAAAAPGASSVGFDGLVATAAAASSSVRRRHRRCVVICRSSVVIALFLCLSRPRRSTWSQLARARRRLHRFPPSTQRQQQRNRYVTGGQLVMLAAPGCRQLSGLIDSVLSRSPVVAATSPCQCLTT
jgi:hypothetical protein